MGIIYLCVLLIGYLFIIEIFAIAFKATGLKMSKARFQVISILTGTGFTTQEAELIVQHPDRRKITQYLMLISYLGFATVAGVFYKIIQTKIDLKNLVIGSALIAVFLAMTHNRWFITRFEHLVEKNIYKKIKKMNTKPVNEVLKLNEEYGVVELVIDEKSPLIGVSLKDSGLKKHFIQVLNIESPTKMTYFASKDHVFSIGEVVVLYGNLRNIQDIFFSHIKSVK